MSFFGKIMPLENSIKHNTKKKKKEKDLETI
jgi:hypothetical protein